MLDNAYRCKLIFENGRDMRRICVIILVISLTLLLLFTLCACESKTSDDSTTSPNSSSLSTNSDLSKDSDSDKSSDNSQNGDAGSIGSSSDSKSNSTTPKASSTATSINTYEELVNVTVGTKVTVEGISTQSAFDRAWSGTHYKFTMTFGDSKNDEIYIDMSTDKKAQDIVRGTRVSVTGVVTGLKGASGGREVPEIQLDSYKILS